MGESNTFFNKFSLYLFHILSEVVSFHRMTVKAELIIFLIDGQKLVWDSNHGEQRVVYILVVVFNKVYHLCVEVLGFRHRNIQSVQLHVL